MEYTTNTALIVVDMQNDFVDPQGNLYVEGGETIVARINREIEAAREARAAIVYSRDWHPPETPHFQPQGGRWPVHCVRDTWGAEYHPELLIVEDAVHIKKGQGGEDGYSAFSQYDVETGEDGTTGLGVELWQREVIQVVLVGLAEDVCVKETALDARRRNLITTIIQDGTRAVDPAQLEEVRHQLRQSGVRFA